ncbi:MAG TPA: ester cyclase [Acetobacteraceae bacterium]
MTPKTPGYPDVPSFIYGITREIWEDRGIGGKLDHLYAPNILLRAPTGFTTDNTGVTSQTLQTLHSFPDRQLVGEDVIWAGYDDGAFLSSHRLVSVMRHTGDSAYGPATGRIVRSRIIADCWVVDGVVTEEWLARDQAAFAACLGIEPRALARQMVAQDLRRTGAVAFFLPEHDRPGLYRPEVQAGPDIELYTEGYRRIWGAKDPSAIRDLYFHGADLAAPGGGRYHGHVDIDRFVLGYLASFPDAEFSVQSAIVNTGGGQATRVALRWSLRGTHAGFGHFGEPTGAPIYIMGFSHAEIVAGRVQREWLVTDEVSIWKQVEAHLESQSGNN